MSQQHPDVATDPALSPAERETTIRWAADEDRATIHTDEPPIIRSLLAHEWFEIDEERRYEGTVVSVRGKLPLGCITVKGTRRQDDLHSKVVP